MAQQPTHLTALDVSAFAITPQTRAADGTFTDGTSSTISGFFTSFAVQGSKQLEEISAADSVEENFVRIKRGTSFRCETLLNTVFASNKLATLMSAGEWFKVVFTRGGGTWTLYVVGENYEENIQKGACTGVATFKPCGVAPVYAAAV